MIGNNLVNAQTTGFRADRMVTASFAQELLTRREQAQNTVLGEGTMQPIAIVDEVVSTFEPGTLKQTDRTLDVAIVGDGYFQIQGADGNQYLTRNGCFDLDENGTLVLPGYGSVVGTNGTITLDSAEITIDTNGVIYDAAGNAVATIALAIPNGEATMQKLDNGLFAVTAGGTTAFTEGYLIQNALEQSNVDLNQELTNLIDAQRAFQACSSALQINDALNRKANQIASIS